jgi:transposase InsO family protein
MAGPGTQDGTAAPDGRTAQAPDASAHGAGDSGGLDRLIDELRSRRSTTLLSLVPAEGPAILRAHREAGQGWQMDLDCCPPLADRLQLLVSGADNGEEAGLGPCELHDHTGRDLVHVFIQCHRPELMRALLSAVIDDHTSRCPTERVAALVQVDAVRAPHRIDVRVPPRPKPKRARTMGTSPRSAAS